jgi:tetratricopeptide (TPR) repeat protein
MHGDLHSYLSTMISTARSKSGGELLLFSVEQVVAGAGPRQADVLRKVAVPRWVDASVLRALREKDDGNERVLELLQGYSFVRDLGDGRLAYHDEVRRAMLEEWQRERPEELREIHRRLYQHFSQRTTPPGSPGLSRPLTPEGQQLSAVPMSPQADLLRREALYHLLWLDQARGLAELRQSFDYLAEGHRLAEAELLLRTAEETPLDDAGRRWVGYMRARVLQASLNLDAAAEQLDALQRQGGLDADLAAEVSRARGEIFAETGQWARATELYRHSLDHFAAAGNTRAAADTLLLLGEAYQGLGVSTGSWHAPEATHSPLLRAAAASWTWLLGLPFQLAIAVLGRANRALPRPAHSARYQNWLLIRLYNTARTFSIQARDAFRVLGDAAGTLRAEQRLADILLLYGYHDEARSAVEELLQRPEARDPYRKAWLQRSLAECLLACGDTAGAQALLAEALQVFKSLGDVRREATVRYLQGRAAMASGDTEAALASYAVGLERFRALRYATARERLLDELRDWKRRPDAAPAVVARVDELVAAEPEKRYVGRFIRSYLALLQVVSVMALPLAMLLMAIVAPITALAPSTSGVVSQTIFFDPARVFGVALILAPLYLAVYAAIGIAVIFVLPISRIEREQPDVIVTTPEQIARYDRKGTLALAQPWPAVRRWVALDRRLWARPMELYSRTYLEDESGRDLPIDGITSWYGELQGDIGRRLDAARNPLPREDLGYSLLRSPWGAAFGLGLLLLVLVTWSNNNWVNFGGLFPPPLAAALWFLGLSGALILAPLAYWIATRPLSVQRTLQLNERWPIVISALGAALVVSYLIPVSSVTLLPALNQAIFVWGVYVLAEALMALAAPRRRGLRIFVVAVTTLLALLLVARPALAHYRWLESYVARKQVQSGVVASADSCAAAASARSLGSAPADTYLIQGDCAAAVGDWAQAAEFYLQAARNAPPGSSNQALALYNLSVATAYTGNAQLSDQSAQTFFELCRSSAEAQPLCAEILDQGLPRP